MAKLISVVLLCLVFACSAFAHSVSTNQKECPLVCPALYSPVCSTNGRVFKEFGNPCELSASNCRLERASLKPYRETDIAWCTSILVENLRDVLGSLDYTKPECMKPCTLIYSPVCVSNGEYRATVGHICEMDFLNCVMGEDNSKQFRPLKDAPC